MFCFDPRVSSRGATWRRWRRVAGDVWRSSSRGTASRIDSIGMYRPWRASRAPPCEDVSRLCSRAPRKRRGDRDCERDEASNYTSNSIESSFPSVKFGLFLSSSATREI